MLTTPPTIPSPQPSQTQYVARGAVIAINSTGFMHNTLATITHQQAQASAMSSEGVTCAWAQHTNTAQIVPMCHMLTRRHTHTHISFHTHPCQLESVGLVTVFCPTCYVFPVFTGRMWLDFSLLGWVPSADTSNFVAHMTNSPLMYWQKQWQQYLPETTGTIDANKHKGSGL